MQPHSPILHHESVDVVFVVTEACRYLLVVLLNGIHRYSFTEPVTLLYICCVHAFLHMEVGIVEDCWGYPHSILWKPEIQSENTRNRKEHKLLYVCVFGCNCSHCWNFWTAKFQLLVLYSRVHVSIWSFHIFSSTDHYQFVLPCYLTLLCYVSEYVFIILLNDLLLRVSNLHYFAMCMCCVSHSIELGKLGYRSVLHTTSTSTRHALNLIDHRLQ